MTQGNFERAGMKMPGSIRRRRMDVSPESLVKIEPLYTTSSLPLLIRPVVNTVDLISWSSDNRSMLEKHLLEHGALLFRDFSVSTVQDFEKFIEGVSGSLLEYRERSSPRSQVSGNVYTSTDHPADQSIFLHNENSYQRTWPLRIFFFARLPAQQGGETPIADVRRVYERISPATRERFRQRRVMYMRNFGDGLGLPWQTVFQTSDKAAVEEYCRKADMQYEWKDGERLRTRRVGQAVLAHPHTKEMLWFNHAAFFHVTTLEPSIREALLAQFTEEDLPGNSYYGDGSPIEDAVLDEIREAYKNETVAFSWQKGDILMVDNMLVAHGRSPFTGPRQILTGMTMPVHASE